MGRKARTFEIDRGTCIEKECNNLQRINHKTKDGFQGYGIRCNIHHKIRYKMHKANGRQYFAIPKIRCQKCGFVAIHICQLDHHHIDGNKNNNGTENIEVLCANCHRLIHFGN